MKQILNVLLSLSCGLYATTTYAAPIQWTVGSGGNGHSYEILLAPSGGIDWPTAQADALSRGGYLATLTSIAESDFVFDNLVDNPAFWAQNSAPFKNQLLGPWIGGLQPVGSAEPGGGWEWVNGDGTFDATFSNWDTSEPNNFGSGEDRALFFNNDNTPPPAEIINAWNDVISTSLVPSYVVEYAVPEPASCTLLALGFIAFTLRRAKN